MSVPEPGGMAAAQPRATLAFGPGFHIPTWHRRGAPISAELAACTRARAGRANTAAVPESQQLQRLQQTVHFQPSACMRVHVSSNSVP